MLNYSLTKKVPIIRQTEIAECGIACLAMVLSYHGQKVDMQYMRSHCTTGLKGISLSTLSDIATNSGLAARGLKCELESLKNLTLPAIIHWDMNHFVVLTKVTKHYVVINDPARGQVKATWREVDDNYTGIALELTPTDNFNKDDKRTPLSLNMLWRKMSHLKRGLFKVFALSMIVQGIILLMPYYMKIMIDDVIVSHDTELLLLLAIGFGLITLFDVFARTLRGWIIIRLSSSFGLQSGINIVSHLFKLPITYFESRHIGDINSRIASLKNIRDTLSQGLIEAVVDGLMSAIIVFVLFSYSTLLGGIVLGVSAAYLLIRIILYKAYRRDSEEQIVKSAEEQTHFMETIRGIQTVRLYNHEPKRLSIWQNKFVDVINSEIKLGRLTLSFDIFNRMLFGIENVVIVFLAAHMVLDGELTLGAIIAFIAYKKNFTESAARLIENLLKLKIMSLHLERISDITLEDKEEATATIIEPNNVEPKDIVLENVSFRYDEHAPYIFENINLTIQAGESVVITGHSGCGKTTLIKIMLGLIKPTSGRILYGGEDIYAMGLNNYREIVSSVMQEDALFGGSIAENISFFDNNMDQKRLDKAAYRAAIYDEIMQMPMGYQSFVGDMGSTLSGGQKQRVLIARALYKDTPVVFMDEATSHLDGQNEERIMSYFKALNKTRISVAHRQETIKSADREIRLEHL